MKFKRFSYGTLGLLAAGGLGWGCSDKAGDCNANKNCAAYDGGAASVNTAGASGSAGSGGKGSGGTSGNGDSGAAGDFGSAGAGGGVPACNPSANPDSEPCVIDDAVGLFVSPDGNDKAAGTREKPFATVTHALSVAGAGALKRLYVCAGEYTEADTLVIPNRVELYGGFDCDDWSYSAQRKAFITSANPVGASISAAAQGVKLQDVRIDAANAMDGAGASSFGLIINSSAVTLTRVEIRAGNGTAGQNGAVGTVGSDGTDSNATQDGTASCAAAAVSGTAVAQSACGSKGGNGGLGYKSSDGDRGLKGIPEDDVTMPKIDNGGAGAKQTGPTIFGSDGTFGYPGNAGDHGGKAKAVGVFSAGGFSVASGGDGTDGHTGQGGGGGGASKGNGTCVGASGGAGGMGGCGGLHGMGGTGGGASVAVLSWASSLTIDACTFIAADGGPGGKGGAAGLGGAGKAGGKGGSGNANIGDAGKGGKGGFGGRGGSGAGGSGGPSVALVYDGTPPVLKSTSTLTPSTTGGARGLGGRPDLEDDTTWGFDGSDGIKADIYPPLPK